MNAYEVPVTCEGKVLDVYVVAESKDTAEALAWAHDDHFEVMPRRTILLDVPLTNEHGVQAVLACPHPEVHS